MGCGLSRAQDCDPILVLQTVVRDHTSETFISLSGEPCDANVHTDQSSFYCVVGIEKVWHTAYVLLEI